MLQKDLPQLLAPAGSMAALRAAVNAGADAVYLAGENFSARQYAPNFSRQEIGEALKYAHLRGVKVYVTVNTLIKDSELQEVADYLFWLYEAGADAVIVQDLGVASLCQDLVPELNIHASTQMTIHNREGVKWAQKFGFKRVILAREMKYSEVAQIVAEKNKIELEIFAHGALCYSYSGQCLLSSFIGGRSGNRGRCAQSCRRCYQLWQGKVDHYGKPYDLVSRPFKDEYLLSTHDLSLYEDMDKILHLKVDSLKIEGRMRSPQYVATVVSIYRKALQEASQDRWKPNLEDVFKLELAFNRGFSGGYLLESHKDSVMGREAPGNRGLYLGRVLKYIKKDKTSEIQLETHFTLEKGDGIVFISPEGEKFGMAVQETPRRVGEKIFLPAEKPVQQGSEVYLTRFMSLVKDAADMGKDKPADIPLDMQVSWDKEGRTYIQGDFTDFQDKRHKILFKTDLVMDKAIKRPLSKEQIKNQLKKTGNTPFIIRKLEIEYPGALFTPLSRLNQVRRDFLKKAENEILENQKPLKSHVKSGAARLIKIKQDLKPISKPKAENKVLKRPSLKLAVYISSLQALKGALKGSCRHIYFQPFLWEEYGRKTPCNEIDWNEYHHKMLEMVQKAQELCSQVEAELVWKWPSISKDTYLKNSLPLLNPLFEGGLTKIMVEDMGAAQAIKKINPAIELYGSGGLNVWNHLSINTLSSTFKAITLSNELNKEELALVIARARCRGLDNIMEYLVEGNLESMVSEDCLLSGFNLKDEAPFYGIRDVKNRLFPVIIDDEGRTHILNSVELCLMDHLPSLHEMGVDRLVIDARNRTPHYCREMVALYREGIKELEKNGADRIKRLKRLKNRIKKISRGGITTGSFINGLKE